MERRKSTLENRISKLERTLSRNRNEGMRFEEEGRSHQKLFNKIYQHLPK